MQLKDENDKKIYKRFLEGENNALGELMMKYKSNLIYFIFRYVKDEQIAEDIFQDTMIYLINNREMYNFNYSFKTFLYTIAKSRALNYLKKEKKKEEYIKSEENSFIEQKLLEEVIISKERQEKIKNVINKMSDEYKMVIYLAIIENLSYIEIARLMEKSVSQIKNLLHRARVKLRKLLIQEKIVEIQNNKIIKFLIVFIVIGMISSGIVYASKIVYEYFNNVTINPTYQSTLNENTINNLWVGTLDLAWKELEEKIGGKIELVENIEIVEELNASEFSKEMLNPNDYKINVERTETNGYKIEATLNKELNFLEVFDNFRDYKYKFGKGSEAINYFGINNASLEKLNKNVEILFYNRTNSYAVNNDFAVKLKTKEGDEIILYRTDDKKTFKEYYEDIQNKTQEYTGEREFLPSDELLVPYVKVSGMICYNELYGKEIKNSNGLYIYDTIQNVEISLNERGCNLSSQATMVTEYNSGGNRYCWFKDTFIMFMKEKNCDNPYFALKVDNDDILVKCEETDEPKILDYTMMKNSEYYKVEDGEYLFYEDEKYEYYYKTHKSEIVKVYFKSGTDMTVEEALKEGLIKLELLDKYGVEYIKKEK